MSNFNWRKSTYSGGGSGTDCVEVADAEGTVRVHDTRNREGGTLAFTASAWGAFLGKFR
jgi:hypothetical protein